MEAEFADMASARRKRLGIVAGESETAPQISSASSSTPMPLPAPTPGGDESSPQRYVHVTKKTSSSAAVPTSTAADLEDLEDEPVLMDEEPERSSRNVSLA